MQRFQMVPSQFTFIQPASSLLQFLNLETWGQRLLQLFGLLFVLDDKCVQKSGASDLEFGAVRVLLDLHTFGILSPGLKEEILVGKSE